MPTVREIQAGKYCQDCSCDCEHFNREADCCKCDTVIGRIYSDVVDSDYKNKEMKFERRL